MTGTNHFRRNWARRATLAVLLLGPWVALQIVFRDRLVYHDSWRHGFPIFYAVAKETTCRGLPRWLGVVDSGSPLIIYVMSFSLLQIVRLPALFLTGCLRLDVISAMYVYLAQFLASYLALAGGMFVLGRLLFSRRLSALFLFVGTLYAGLFLDASHSGQVLAIIFWMPWIIVAAVQFHRHDRRSSGAWFLSAAVLFACLGALDQYPHFMLLAAVAGGGLYVAVWRPPLRELVRRHASRLWPAALVLMITAFQLWVANGTVGGYRPSVRSDLVLHRRDLAEVVFVQPAALIAMFLPIDFLAGFGDVRGGLFGPIWRQTWWLFPLRALRFSIFPLDSLLFYVGFVPAVLALAFGMRPGVLRLRLWWAGFALAMFLVALQQSHLAYLLFSLPFFNLFRAYILYGVFVVFAVLVMAGYGMDAYLILESAERRRLVTRSLGIVLGLTALAALVLGVVLPAVTSKVAPVRLRYLLPDLLIVAVSALALWRCGRSRRPERSALGLLLVLVLCQSVYWVAVQKLVDVPFDEVFAAYQLDAEDRTPVAPETAHDPNRFRRKECRSFGECYVSLRDTASLRRGPDGTFLRNHLEPVLQDDLALPVTRALSGLTHPVFWLSRMPVGYGSSAELVARLNGHQADIGEHLRRVVYLPGLDLGRMGVAAPSSRGSAELTFVERGPDTIRLGYRADVPVILNAAITFDPHWRARVNGSPAAVWHGNLNGLAVALPPGPGSVELRYRSGVADAFFYSRYLCLIAGAVAAAWLARSAIRRGERLGSA